MKNSFEKLDSFIDGVLGERGYAFLLQASRYLVSLVSIVLLIVCTAHFVGQSSEWNAGTVRADLSHLEEALKNFDGDCGIQEVLSGGHSLLFLTQTARPTDAFAAFKLANENTWRGPYIHKVPVAQGYPYMLLKTNKGLFIVPGEGVRLPKGSILGKEFFLTAESNLKALSAAGGILSHNGEPLVREFICGVKDADGIVNRLASWIKGLFSSW